MAVFQYVGGVLVEPRRRVLGKRNNEEWKRHGQSHCNMFGAGESKDERWGESRRHEQRKALNEKAWSVEGLARQRQIVRSLLSSPLSLPWFMLVGRLRHVQSQLTSQWKNIHGLVVLFFHHLLPRGIPIGCSSACTSPSRRSEHPALLLCACAFW